MYFLQNNTPVYVEAAVRYLQTYLKAVRNWIEKYSEFSTSAEKDEARQYVSMAEQVLHEHRNVHEQQQ